MSRDIRCNVIQFRRTNNTIHWRKKNKELSGSSWLFCTYFKWKKLQGCSVMKKNHGKAGMMSGMFFCANRKHQKWKKCVIGCVMVSDVFTWPERSQYEYYRIPEQCLCHFMSETFGRNINQSDQSLEVVL